MDFLVVGQVAQSESLKDFNWTVLEVWKKIPDPGANLRYLRIQKAVYW